MYNIMCIFVYCVHIEMFGMKLDDYKRNASYLHHKYTDGITMVSHFIIIIIYYEKALKIILTLIFPTPMMHRNMYSIYYNTIIKV